MRIRFNEEIGTLDVDGVIISASVLRDLVNPDRRLLFRFQRKDGIITAMALTEKNVVWIDNPDEIADQTTDFGIAGESADRKE